MRTQEPGDAAGPAAPEGSGAAFGTALRRHRRAAGLTQEALAERAGVGVRTLQGLERGEAHPLRATARRLADGLGLPAPARAPFLAAAAPPPRVARGPGSGRGGLRLVPPPATGRPPGRPGNLPAELTSFVGRTSALAAVAGLLAARRSVTLIGPGGVGKTRLALRVAADRRPAYPDGVWLVELAALRDPGLVPTAVAAPVGVREERGRPVLATLTDALRPKRLLLVLDNCEHLLDACARLADALLRACPHLTVLATSREALGVAGETVWPVPSLDPPAVPADAPGPPAETLARSEAVRLFRDRAVAVHPSFRMTDQNAPVVAALCRRLDGIPLALELAAVRVRALPVEQVLARLEDRFRLLTGGSRTAPARHQTLRAAVDWSYDLLPAPEQALFRRLAVFAGGFTLAAAEAVGAGAGTAADEVLDRLTHLVDASLVVLDPAPAGGGGYRLLETLRQYALQRLTACGEDGLPRERHAAHYLGLAEAAEPALWGPEQAAGFAALEAELGNLRAALAWAAAHDRGCGLRLATALGRLWLVRGLQEEGRRWLHDLLRPDAAAAAAAEGLRARGLTWAARLAWRGGRLAAARTLAEESVALHRTLGEAGDARWYAWALTVLGTVAYFERRLDAAATALRDALALARRHGQEEVVTSVLFAQGHIARVRGDPATARQRYAQALARWRRRGDSAGVATALLALGTMALQAGDLETAAARFAEALEAARAVGGREDVGASLEGLGWVAEARGDPDTARAWFAEALALYRDLGRRARVTNVSVALAGLALDAGETGAARRHLREPLDDAPARLAEEVGSQLRWSGSASPPVRELGRAPGARGTRPSPSVDTIWFGLPRVLLSLACLAAAERRPERALRLAGAAEALNPSWRTGAPGRPHAGGQDPLVGRADRWLAVARAALSPPAQDAAWAAGQAMTLAEAVTDALADAPHPG